MVEDYNCKLIFEDGNEYLGYSFGDFSEKVCEIVFNTSMVGYSSRLIFFLSCGYVFSSAAGDFIRSFLYLSGGCYDLSSDWKLRYG